MLLFLSSILVFHSIVVYTLSFMAKYTRMYLLLFFVIAHIALYFWLMMISFLSLKTRFLSGGIFFLFSIYRSLHVSEFKLTCRDSENTMHFSFFTIRFFPLTQKITILMKVSVSQKEEQQQKSFLLLRSKPIWIWCVSHFY